MARRLTQISLIVGLLAVAVPASWASLTFTFDHFEQVAANTDYVTLVRWERLNRIRQLRRLSHLEWQIWCRLGRQLSLFRNGVCPAR